MTVYGEIERRVTAIVTDKELYELERYIEKDHAVLCLFLLHTGKGQWGSAKEYANKHGLTLPDVTFRARMKEAEERGLATSESINNDPIKRRWVETKLGYRVNESLLELFSKARLAS